jgi:hypothetical protein
LQVDNALKEKLPKFCYTVVPSANPGSRICIVQRGESGCYCTDLDGRALTLKDVEQVVRKLNEQLGITEAQEIAMASGCMFGWHVPAADPDEWRGKA